MNSQEIQEKIIFLEEIYKDNPQIRVFKTVLDTYQQMLKQINILKDIESWQPDPLGIDPYSQISHHCRWAARDYLKEIGEI